MIFMKKFFAILMGILLVGSMVLPAAMAEPVATESEVAAEVQTTGEVLTSEVEIPTEPFTWQYLASITGAAAFTLLVVQFFKVPLDKVWKIPTRVLAYVIALITMIVAMAFTTGLDAQTVLLAAANAFIAALISYGAYELTFAKTEK